MKMSLHILGTKEELQQVLASIGSRSTPETPRAVIRKVRQKVALTSPENRMKWKRKENAYLRSAVTTTSLENMAKTLGRTPLAVRVHLSRMGLYSKYRRAQAAREYDALPAVIQRVRVAKKRGPMKKWTYPEDQQIRQFHGKMSNAEIAKRLGRSTGAVEQRAWFLKVTKPKSHNGAPEASDVVVG